MSTLTTGRAAGAPGAPRFSAGEAPAFAGLHRRKLHLSNWALIAFALAFGAWANETWLFIIGMSLLTGILSLGTLVVVGYARETSLMQAGLCGTALYIAGWAYRSNTGGLNWPFPLAMALGVSVTVLISVVVALVAYRLSAMYIMVLTLAVQFTIENSIFLSERLTGGLQSPQVPRPNFYGESLRSDRTLYFFLLAITVIVTILMCRFRSSRFGRAMIMVGNDKQAAAAAGVNPWSYKVAAFAIAGLLAGIGGALWAPQLNAPPGPDQFSTMQSLFFLAVPVLAGFESVVAVVVIGMAFMALPMAATQVGWSPQPFILGGVALLIGVLLGPRGMAGAFSDGVAKARKTFAADGIRGFLRMPRVRRPRFLHLPDREAARAYRQLRDSDTDSPWAHNKPLREVDSSGIREG